LLLAALAAVVPMLVVWLSALVAGPPADSPPLMLASAQSAARKQLPAPAETAHPLAVGEEAILDELKKPTAMEFKDLPLKDVVSYLQDLHHIPIQLDVKELESMNVGEDTRVTKNLKGISLRSALKLMLDELGLKYVVHNEVLLITSPTKAESEEFLTTKFYDVADLLAPVPDLPYRGGVLPGGRASGEPNRTGEPASCGQVGPFVVSVIPVFVPTAARPNVAGPDIDDVISLITATVATKSWDANGGQGNVTPFDRSLAICQTQDVHEQISDLLVQLRTKRRAAPVLLLDLQWLWLDAAGFGQLLGEKPVAGGHAAAVIDEQVLSRLAGKAPGFRGRVVSMNGQLTHLASGDRRSVLVGAMPAVAVQVTQSGAAGAGTGGTGGMGMGGMFAVPAETPAAGAAPAPTPPAGGQTGGAPCGTAMVGRAGMQPPRQAALAAPPSEMDLANAGIVLEVRPTIAPGADMALLDLRSTVSRWGQPPAAAPSGAAAVERPVDRVNMPVAEFAATARVPLGKPVLLGAVTFAPAEGAGLDKPSENPLQLCLIATTSIAAEPATAPKK
jgi:hypothetical protein